MSSQRVGILNRGAPALRLLHALRERASSTAADLRSVVLCPAGDRNALYVREADAWARCDAGHLDAAAVEEALATVGVDAAWCVGTGSPVAAAACDRLGLTWLGTRATWDPVSGDLRALGERAGVPVAARPAADERVAEVQLAADGEGGLWVLGVRDATLAREHRVVLYESACTQERAAPDAELQRCAVELAGLIGLRGLATVRFTCRPDRPSFALAGLEPWLTEGHDVTEAVTGLDLAGLQLELALGGRLTGAPPEPRGHALSTGVHAEDPEVGFVPAPGRVALLRLPSGTGLRVDVGTAQGDQLPDGLDAQIARLVANGRDRAQALARLRRALTEMVVVVEGGASGRDFLVDVLDAPETRAGAATAGWFRRFVDAGGADRPDTAGLALLVAAADAYDRELEARREAFFATARRGRPEAASAASVHVALRHRGRTAVLAMARLGPTTYRAEAGPASVEVELERVGPYESRLTLAEKARVVSWMQEATHLVEIDGVAHRFVRDDAGIVRAGLPGVVVDVRAAVGDRLATGDVVAVVESMKLEMPVVATQAGVVRRVLVGRNGQVAAGAPIAELDAGADVHTSGDSALALPAPAPAPPLGQRERVLRCRARLLGALLGYDASPSLVKAVAEELAVAAAELGPDPLVDATDRELLGCFADLRVLFRSQRGRDDSDLLFRSPQEHLFAYLRSLSPDGEGVAPRFVAQLQRALRRYGVEELTVSPALEDALYRIFQSHRRAEAHVPIVIGALERLGRPAAGPAPEDLRALLDHVVAATELRYPVIADLAREVRHRRFDEPVLADARAAAMDDVAAHLAALEALPVAGGDPARVDHVDALVACTHPLARVLLARVAGAGGDAARVATALEILTRRYYRIRQPEGFALAATDRWPVVHASYPHPAAGDGGGVVHVLATASPLGELAGALRTAADADTDTPVGDVAVIDAYTAGDAAVDDAEVALRAQEALSGASWPERLRRVVVAYGQRPPAGGAMVASSYVTMRRTADGWEEDRSLRGLHPLMATRLRLSRLRNFELTRLPAADDVYLFHSVARENPNDERLFAIAEVRDLTTVTDERGRLVALPELERQLLEALAGIRRFQQPRPAEQRLQWNRVVLAVWPVFDLAIDDVAGIARRLAPATEGLGIEQVVVLCDRVDAATGERRARAVRLSNPTGTGFVITEDDAPTEPLVPLDEYTRKVVSSRQRGTTYPFAIVEMVTAPHAGGRAEVRGGSFVEHDLDDELRLRPVDRPPGRNSAGIVAGVVTNTTDRYPDGMTRVALFGDPTKALGSLAEAECRRIMAALDLAEELDVPLEWYALSAGARIAMDSGTENMDWIAAVLRRIIEFTQRGGELNVVVTGINVGAQPYWNAEATMLMHTKGILVMTPDSAMVLTGKQALDYSGGVSAEDNFGIGGFDRIMGPNGQAQYWAPDLGAAIGVLLAHYDHGYRASGEPFARVAATADPFDRDVCTFPHQLEGSPFVTVGDIFSIATNPDRKLPFDIRTVMRATADLDHEPLERWPSLADGDTAVVWDAHLGGQPVLLLGFESHLLARRGLVPTDGPTRWTSGTLFPMSSKKIARAINAASGSRPLVVLANLSGFDGSPDSMRSRQLEFGAEIGRAVVNFQGPIVFCVISRYHGGAFVVFSKRLNDNMTTIAVEGSRASVIGGAPAAAVVFAGEVSKRTRADARVKGIEAEIAAATGAERARAVAHLAEVTATVRSEKLGEVAAEFDAVHSVERALRVGSVDAIIAPSQLRPYLIDAVRTGIARHHARS